jgi:lipopolysaccharide/colanic/teichoic acid biosynthesis glycosyltransferase
LTRRDIIDHRSIVRASLFHLPPTLTLIGSIDGRNQPVCCTLIIAQSCAPNLDPNYQRIVYRYIEMHSLERHLTRGIQLAVKRAFDIAFSALGLFVLSPVFLLASVAIALESNGTVFSVKHVYGFKNQHIRLLSFRCKTHRTETLVGQFLVRSGLDRLPVLINILRGDMSLVGTHSYVLPPQHFDGQVAPPCTNNFFRPGLFSYKTDELNAIEADLSYILNWSPLLDAKIIFRHLSSDDRGA